MPPKNTASLNARQLQKLVGAAQRILDACQDATPPRDCTKPVSGLLAATALAQTFVAKRLKADADRVGQITNDLNGIAGRVEAILRSQQRIEAASEAVDKLIKEIREAFGITDPAPAPQPGGPSSPQASGGASNKDTGRAASPLEPGSGT